MAQDKSIRRSNREGSPRPRKTTLSDKRKTAQLAGYQRLTGIMFNGESNLPKR